MAKKKSKTIKKKKVATKKVTQAKAKKKVKAKSKAVSKKVAKKISKKVSKDTKKKWSSKEPEKIPSQTKKTSKSLAKKASKKSAKKMNKKISSKTDKKMSQKTSEESKSNQGLKVGDRVPNFGFESTAGDAYFSDFEGKKVVLYFYPKDSTSGCTTEGHDFSNNLNKFQNKNTVVLGVSRDSIKSHHGFKTKQDYKHDLISDPEEGLCNMFGVMKEKSMYGRKHIGVERSTFLIDENGVVMNEWRGVKVPGHVEAVLESI